MLARYEVHHDTLCGGWVNCWTENDRPQTFRSIKAAQAEIDEFIEDVNQEIDDGEREPDEGYSHEEYRIYDRYNSEYVA